MTTYFPDRLADVPARAVLDVGCGAGELTLALAGARRDARLVGLDISSDLVAAFAHLRAIATPGARLAFTCFRERERNLWASGLAELLDAPASLDVAPPGPFACADPVRVEVILHAAGWRDIIFEPVCFAYVAGAGDDPVLDAMDFFARIGPAAPVLRAAEGVARRQFLARIAPSGWRKTGMARSSRPRRRRGWW